MITFILITIGYALALLWLFTGHPLSALLAGGCLSLYLLVWWVRERHTR